MSSAHALGEASVVWHLSLILMDSFNKTEAAIFPCRICLLRDFPFFSLELTNRETILFDASIASICKEHAAGSLKD